MKSNGACCGSIYATAEFGKTDKSGNTGEHQRRGVSGTRAETKDGPGGLPAKCTMVKRRNLMPAGPNLVPRSQAEVRNHTEKN